MYLRRPIRSACALAVCLAASVALADKPPYPATRTENITDVVHGVSITDPYRWLEDVDSEEVQQWIAAQNALTRGYLDQFAPQRQQLAARLTQLYAAKTVSAPDVRANRYFYTSRPADQNHAILYCREGGFDAEPREVLNPNTFSEDGTVALDWWYPSPDGTLIAYGKSQSGNERSTLHVRDVAAGQDRELAIPNTRASTVAWDADGQGFLYTRFPEPGSVAAGDENYFRHVYHHRLGSDWHDDALVFGEGQPKERWPNLQASGDHQYVLLTNGRGWSAQDLYIRKAGEDAFRPVAVDLPGLFSADMLGDRLFILTNYEAPRYRVVAVNADNPAPAGWQEIIPEQKGVIESMQIVGGKLILCIMENAYHRLVVHDPDGKLVTEIELPTLGSVNEISGRHDAHELFFVFESFTHPPTLYRYDLGTHEMAAVDRMPLDIDAGQYTTRQIWFNSKDGTRVPMFVICRQNTELTSNNPTVIYGYGGFNISVTPSLLQHPLPFIDAGGVYVLVNLRGGGEFGEQWHQAGQLANKQNVFDDMIAAAEKLIADGYTRPERLAVCGGSNGGLLVGAVITQRPKLVRAAYCAVPLLDMVRYHRFSIARLWIPEYGSAEDAEQFKFLHAYSPYHHVQTGTAYPAVLFATAESDSRVHPMHALKMTALMQAATSSDNPVLLKVETKAGHGQGKPLNKQIDSYVDEWTFLMWQLGMFDETTTSQPTQ